MLTDTPVPLDLCALLVADGIDADQISAAAYSLQARGVADDWVDAVIESAGYSRPAVVGPEDMAAPEPALIVVICFCD